MKHLNKLIVLAFSLLFLLACKHNKILKSTDLTYKYEMANKYFEKGQYYRAVPLLEELIPIYRGTEKSERLYYIYAYCDYYMQDYILAAHRFSTFVKTFPFSRFSEECQFMSAICHYKLSPKFSLDQEDTYSALSQFQSFINQYPQSEKVDSCHVLLDELRQKLEEKSFQTSVQYYHTQHYKAALTALNNCIQDFPDTKHREEIVFLMVKANFNWAKNSVESKKEERFLNTKKAYAKFAGSYPESEFKKEALEVLDKVNEELELIKYKNS